MDKSVDYEKLRKETEEVNEGENEEEKKQEKKQEKKEGKEGKGETEEKVEKVEKVEKESIEKKELDRIISNNLYKNSYNFNALCLSGGGMKGLLMLGSLQCLYDMGYMTNVKKYAGTSAGSIISYLLCIGYKPIEIMNYICVSHMFEKIQFIDLLSVVNMNGGLNFNFIQDTVEKMTINKIGMYLTMKDIKKKFGCELCITSFNVTDNKIEYITHETYPDIPCITALKMSCNVPLLFENFKYMGKYYIDGGFMDNFPIEHMDEDGYNTIGLTIDYDYLFDLENDKTSILDYVNHLLYLKIFNSEKLKIKNLSNKCKIFVVESTNIQPFNFKLTNPQKLNLYSDGYVKMKEHIESTWTVSSK